MKLTDKQTEFFLAAMEHARMMTSDFRNSRDAKKIQQRIDTSRGEYYAAYLNLEGEYSK